MENQINLLGSHSVGGDDGRAALVMCSYVFCNSVYKMFHAC